MRVLLSSIGSRGDVQPILALALELRLLGHDPRLCVAPNFRAWVDSFGIACFPIGPDLKQLTGGRAPRQAGGPSPEQLRQLAVHSVRSQFPALFEAARGCDLVVAAGALQIATRSVAEALGIPYLFVAYCPAVLPSPDHPPPKMGMHHPQSLPSSVNSSLWADEERRWDELFRETLNEERSNRGLDPIQSVQRHIFTERPWLAADSVIGPAGASSDLKITQTGPWLLSEPSALRNDVERFLEGGSPPVYFGFGSMRASENTTRTLIEAARALGLRSILSRGWGNLAPIDADTDCLAVDEVSHERLFPRVAAIVHHGGAGTTTAAARAGKPQVVVPHLYDQYYWAHRVEQLGIGVSGPEAAELTVDGLASALRQCLEPRRVLQARDTASRIEPLGARIAAEQLSKGYE